MPPRLYGERVCANRGRPFGPQKQAELVSDRAPNKQNTWFTKYIKKPKATVKEVRNAYLRFLRGVDKFKFFRNLEEKEWTSTEKKLFYEELLPQGILEHE